MVDTNPPPPTLLERIEAALTRWKISQTKFGYDAAGDPALVMKMRQGMVVRQKRQGKIERYLDRLAAEEMTG